MYIMHSCLLSHKYEQLLLKAHFKIHNFQGQKHFWTKCAQMGYIKKFINSSPFALIIINVKILSNFQKEWCTISRKKDVEKNKDCPFSKLSAFMQKHFWFILNFEHVNFVINEKYSINFITIQIIMLHFYLSNIQKCNFKECPFTSVAPLTMFLPNNWTNY